MTVLFLAVSTSARDTPALAVLAAVAGAPAFLEETKLVASTEPGASFGYSVSVSGDTAVVGALLEDGAGSDAGAAYVFTRSGTTWGPPQRLTASDGRVYRAGRPAPLASVLNFAAGFTRSNNSIVTLGADGQINVRCEMLPSSTSSTHFVLDVFGYFR